MAEKFKATEETKAAFPAASQQLEAAAFSMADDFLNSGQTPSEATSLVAHMMVRVAWKVALCGRLADGAEPNPDAFREVVEDALNATRFAEPSADVEDTPDAKP